MVTGRLGRASALPPKIGFLLKKLNVPVVTVITDGAFLRQPLYNELITRRVKVKAEVKCLLTPEEIAERSVDELDKMIGDVFSFDNFKSQAENNIVIDHKDRAQGLHRLLYRCPHCASEGKTRGEGTTLTCHACGKAYKMDFLGNISAIDGESRFTRITDWVDWQRECVKSELERGEYRLEADVEIGIIKDNKALYMVGNGRLIHDENGFALSGCNGELQFSQPPLASHSINADFYWYTMGDIICIGDKEMLYYCFTPENVSVFKARLAAEELYKIVRASKRRR